MIDLFGDPVKTRKPRKRQPPLPAFAAASANGRRFKAWVIRSQVETLSGPVSKNAWVWLVGDKADAVQSRRMIRAYKRLKQSGYRHVLAEAAK